MATRGGIGIGTIESWEAYHAPYDAGPNTVVAALSETAKAVGLDRLKEMLATGNVVGVRFSFDSSVRYASTDPAVRDLDWEWLHLLDSTTDNCVSYRRAEGGEGWEVAKSAAIGSGESGASGTGVVRIWDLEDGDESALVDNDIAIGAMTLALRRSEANPVDAILAGLDLWLAPEIGERFAHDWWAVGRGHRSLDLPSGATLRVPQMVRVMDGRIDLFSSEGSVRGLDASMWIDKLRVSFPEHADALRTFLSHVDWQSVLRDSDDPDLEIFVGRSGPIKIVSDGRHRLFAINKRGVSMRHVWSHAMVFAVAATQAA